MSDPSRKPLKVDLRTLLRAPTGADSELLQIFLKYNDVLLDRGISTFNIWMKRAHYLYGLGRLDEAVDAIEGALKHEPLSSDAHFLLGVCLQLQGVDAADGRLEGGIPLEARSLLESASIAFEAALELNPEDLEAGGFLTNLRCLLLDPSAPDSPIGLHAAAEPAEGDPTPAA